MKFAFQILTKGRAITNNLYQQHHVASAFLWNCNHQFRPKVRYLSEKVDRGSELICSIGTIGHVDHGKTTLTAAITKYLSEQNKNCRYVSYDEIDKAPEEKKRGITINIAHIGYATEKRRYAHVDCPGHSDFVKNMISGASQMDGAILLVAANDGTMPQTKEHLLLVKQMGIKHIVVYINKADLADKEILELVEIEVRELLAEYGYDSLNSPFIYGSALLALQGDTSIFGTPSIKSLLDAIDAYIPNPQRDYSSPFLLPIDNVFTVPGRGTVAVGTIKRGVIKKNMEVQLLGFNDKINTTISDIQIFQKSVPSAVAGENVGVLLRGVKLSSVRRGMLVCAANSVILSNHFEAHFYLLNQNEGGRAKPLQESGYCTSIYSSTWNIYCRFDLILPSGTSMLMPGEHAITRLTLLCCMPVIEGQIFTVREHKRTIGTGRITRVMKRIPVNKLKMNQVEISDLKKSDQTR